MEVYPPASKQISVVQSYATVAVLRNRCSRFAIHGSTSILVRSLDRQIQSEASRVKDDSRLAEQDVRMFNPSNDSI